MGPGKVEKIKVWINISVEAFPIFSQIIMYVSIDTVLARLIIGRS